MMLRIIIELLLLVLLLGACSNIPSTNINTWGTSNQPVVQQDMSIGARLPPSSLFPRGVDCENTQTWAEDHECVNYISNNYGTAAAYSYIGRMKEHNRQREERESSTKKAEEAAIEEKWISGMPGVLHGVSVVPGAIVCQDYPTVELMFDWYSSHWQETFATRVTQGQYSEIHGQPIPPPNFERHGCVLVPNGTQVTMTRPKGKIFPVVTGRLPSGATFRGVTLPSMHTP